MQNKNFLWKKFITLTAEITFDSEGLIETKWPFNGYYLDVLALFGRLLKFKTGYLVKPWKALCSKYWRYWQNKKDSNTLAEAKLQALTGTVYGGLIHLQIIPLAHLLESKQSRKFNSCGHCQEQMAEQGYKSQTTEVIWVSTPLVKFLPAAS